MTVRIAIFGADEQARPYLDVLRNCSEGQIIATCDPQPLLAERLAAEWGAQAFEDPIAMLVQTCPDVLWACVPAALQGDVLLQAAEQRIAFFVDPPGAATLDQALQIEQIVAEACLVTAVGYDTAYRDVIGEAKEYLGENAIPLALGWWIQPKPVEDTLEHLIRNDGAQVIDRLRYFCGDLRRVQAFSADESSGHVTILHFGFDSGTIAAVTLSTLAHPEPREELELIGNGWSLTFSAGFDKLHVIEPDKTTLLKSLRPARAEQARAFLEAAITGNPAAVQSTYADAVKTIRACEAAFESATTEQCVLLNASSD